MEKVGSSELTATLDRPLHWTGPCSTLEGGREWCLPHSIAALRPPRPVQASVALIGHSTSVARRRDSNGLGDPPAACPECRRDHGPRLFPFLAGFLSAPPLTRPRPRDSISSNRTCPVRSPEHCRRLTATSIWELRISHRSLPPNVLDSTQPHPPESQIPHVIAVATFCPCRSLIVLKLAVSSRHFEL